MSIGYTTFLILFLIISIGFISKHYLAKIVSEGFTNKLPFSNANGDPLLDSFPSTGEKYVNENTYNNIWWHFPVFTVGSYEQITNNLRYRRNPDDGKCITADFCRVLYDSVKNTPNEIYPLPPVPDGPGTRINYYKTQDNLFLANQPGSLLELPAF